MKKIIALVLSLVLLTGCTGFANKDSIMNLLSSPKLSKRENEIVTAIKNYLGQDIILKYPKKGKNISPVLMADLTGDGNEDAVVLYGAPSSGGNIHLAVLSFDNEHWQVIYESEGYGSEVHSIDFVSLSSHTPNQIIIGYTFSDSSEKFMTVYTFSGNSKPNVQVQFCQDYMIYDVTGDGLNDLILAGLNSDNKNTKLMVFSIGEDAKLSAIADKKLSVPNAHVTNISYSKNDFSNSKAIVVDYYDSYYRVATLGVYFEDNQLKTILEPEIVQKNWPYNYSLNSIDVNDDGYLETASIIDDDTSRSEDIKLMEWTCFLKAEPKREYFGVCNALAGIYFPLPDEWQNYIWLSGDEKSWKVTKTIDNTELVKFEQILYGEDFLLDENQKIVTTGTLQVKITFDESVSPQQQKYICEGFMYIK